ncbi:MAG: response regulator [Flavobacteriaceae bacterium]|nr:response regulator [Flavobacteriaceae bacterium]
MTKIKTLIIEDEKNNADLLAHFLNKYCPTIEVIGIAYSKDEAILEIEKEQPDLLFLDIILDIDTAFDLLEEINYYLIQIIFVTAFDEYALRAFRYNAVDYLLKPLQIDDLVAAVNRVQERRENQEFFTQEQIQNLSQTIIGRSPLKFVAISNIDKVNFVKNEDILYCKSSGRYTEFYLTNKQRLVASKSLGEYEAALDQ